MILFEESLVCEGGIFKNFYRSATVAYTINFSAPAVVTVLISLDAENDSTKPEHYLGRQAPITFDPTDIIAVRS